MCLNDQYQCNQRNQLILQIKGLLQWIAQASYTHKRWSTNWKMSFAQLSGILGPAANASILAAWSHLPWSNGKIMYVPWYWVVRQACLYGPIHTVWLSVFRKLSESRVLLWWCITPPSRNFENVGLWFSMSTTFSGSSGKIRPPNYVRVCFKSFCIISLKIFKICLCRRSSVSHVRRNGTPGTGY